MTPVRLVHAHSAAEAATLLRAHAPHAQALAAGGDLLGLWKEAVLERPGDAPVWVNLAHAADLARIEPLPDGGWRLGAMVTLAQLQRTPDVPPLLAEAAGRIASPQLRARTTLGGNLLQRPRCWHFRHPDVACFKKPGGSGCPAAAGPAQAHPGAIEGGPCHAAHPSDLATALLALDAQAEIVGARGTRRLAIGELYRGAAANPEREARLTADEVLAAVIVPPQPPTQAFEKIAPRVANEFAWAAAAVVLQLDQGMVSRARVAVGGIATEPVGCEAADALLRGHAAAAIDVAPMAAALAPALHGASAATRTRVAWCRVAIERALVRALVRGAPTRDG